jgi:hypothetical protein
MPDQYVWAWRDLRLVRQPLRSRLDRTRCLTCAEPLDILQPDVRSPDRFLGICPECGAWDLMECQPDARTALMTVLPTLDELGASWY